MQHQLNITKALADGSRMRVVAALLGNDELCGCQIVELLQLSTATVSRHMSILQNAQLVKPRKDGRWVYYRLNTTFPEQLRRWFTDSIVTTQEMQTDQIQLREILALDPEELCRSQKAKKSVIAINRKSQFPLLCNRQ